MNYRQKVKEHLSDDRWDIYKQFDSILREYRKTPRPVHEVHSRVTRLFNNDPFLMDGFLEFLLETYPAHHAQALAARAERNAAHRQACERQSRCPLLTLPREIRDKIWDEAIRGSIIHVQAKRDSAFDMFFSSKRRKTRTYRLYACRAEKGLDSLACPAGEGDHADCAKTGPNDHPNIRLICKQALLELPDAETTFFSGNAFQFADLETADAFLFDLTEPQRSAIPHLRLAIPFNIATRGTFELWQGILNYFSNPWERKSLHMYPQYKDPRDQLKQPIYFYYSSCYYDGNKDRLHKRCRVGRGSISWDIGISDLKYKPEPKLDLAMRNWKMTEAELRAGGLYHEVAVFDTNFMPWAKPLLQFRQYDGLTFQLYDNEGVTSNPKFEAFVKTLKEHMAEPVIGPRKCLFFNDRPYGNGDMKYADCVRTG